MSSEGNDSLLTDYTRRHRTVLTPLAKLLEKHLKGIVAAYPRVDHVSARAKTIESFRHKATQTTTTGALKYGDPLHEIQDQVGARITTFYLSDVARIQELVEKYFGSIESRRATPDSPSEFDYEGHHYILLMPGDVLRDDFPTADTPKLFELQIKTLFQHAWSQAAHDVSYKPSRALDREQRKLVAFTAAQAWGADKIFEDLFAMLSSGKP